MKFKGQARSTISMDKVVWQMAEAAMERKGFNANFSAYVADLIRRDAERYQAALFGQPPPPETPRKGGGG